MAGKFDNSRDSFLHWACTQDWGMESDGNVVSPSGYFWKIVFSINDITRENTEFNSLLEQWLELEGDVKDTEEFRLDLEGYFLVVEDWQGFVHVQQYPSESSLDAVYASLQETHANWEGQAGE